MNQPLKSEQSGPLEWIWVWILKKSNCSSYLKLLLKALNPYPLKWASLSLKRSRQKGQIVVEYVLLLVISVSLAYLLISQMVSRDATNPGFLVVKWNRLLQVIGSDVPDRHCPGDAKCGKN